MGSEPVVDGDGVESGPVARRRAGPSSPALILEGGIRQVDSFDSRSYSRRWVDLWARTQVRGRWPSRWPSVMRRVLSTVLVNTEVATIALDRAEGSTFERFVQDFMPAITG